jgi:2-oxoglutarate/2-oxoacid ferredoxin oxidoreductase subunit beta
VTWIAKPRVSHPGLPRNELGLTRRDYEGAMSTLCAGCGHDSVTAALIEAFYELDLPPHRIAKLSGIGCSAKTPTYFVNQAHGFNGVHGRMPALAAGVNAANRDLIHVGISGDGDSLSIGLGQFAHAIRRNVDLLYVLENNGVYGLTKGQFSASADVGSKAKRGQENRQPPIDPVLLGLTLGATFVARSFSGDKAQLVPILKAGILHRGFALVDVISPASPSTTTTVPRRDTGTPGPIWNRRWKRRWSCPSRRSPSPTSRGRPWRCPSTMGAGFVSGRWRRASIPRTGTGPGPGSGSGSGRGRW